jgi:type III pantothenate kinase
LPPPRAIVAASVADPTTLGELLAWVRRRWSIVPHMVTAKPEFLGLRNGYREPHTLGADRWAALIGARAETERSVCVVDCGTAVTIDALNADGEFVGGVIFPGVALLREALTRGTAGIRMAEGDEISCLARATADGVAAGSVYGLAGAIVNVTREFEEALEEPMELLMTGGDADRVIAYLARPARHVPDLVLKGLARIAEAT